jgi:hypothetical protein
MSAALLVSDRTTPQITTRGLENSDSLNCQLLRTDGLGLL